MITRDQVLKRVYNSLKTVYRIYVNFVLCSHITTDIFSSWFYFMNYYLSCILYFPEPLSSAENILIKQTKYTYCTCKCYISVRIHVYILKKSPKYMYMLFSWLFLQYWYRQNWKKARKTEDISDLISYRLIG